MSAVAATTLALVPAAVAAGARADDAPRRARAAAETARVRVDQLTADLDAALAGRDLALTGLAGSVQASVAGEQDAEAGSRAAAQATGRHSRAVRALYRSGGQVGLVASLLGSSSPQDALDRARMARRVLDLTAGAAARATSLADSAEHTSAGADAALAARLTTVADVTAATLAAEHALAQAQSQLDALSTEAAALQEAEQARQALERARVRATAAVSRGATVPATDVPAGFEALYRQAATRCVGMRWTLLAAVGQVESRHGQANGPSSAGAVGPMQFMPATFAAYGVDGDGDGTADPWNAADAVHSAAVYLCRNGGGGDQAQVQRSLLRYNNAQWYVDLVLGVEADLVTTGRAG